MRSITSNRCSAPTDSNMKKSLSLTLRSAGVPNEEPPIDAFRVSAETALPWKEVRRLAQSVASEPIEIAAPPIPRTPAEASRSSETWLIRQRRAKPIAAAGLAALVHTTFAPQAHASDVAQVVAQAEMPSADALAALSGHRLELTFHNGVVVAGTLLSSNETSLLIVQEPSGALAEVPRSDLRTIRVLGLAVSDAPPEDFEAREPVTRNHSEGLMIGGIVLTSLGAVSLIAFGIGAFSQSISYSAYYNSSYYGSEWVEDMWPLAVTGGLLVGAGIPMWLVGARDVEVRPGLAFSGGSGSRVSGSLRFSF